MKVYVMRHGATIWNEKGITQGISQNKLSLNGKKLVQDCALKFKNVCFDVIFVSPLMRTMQTANIMNQYHSAKIIKDKRLIEIDQGVFTGKSKNELTEEEKKLKFARSSECGMESYQSVNQRVENFVQELKKNKQYNNILIVTHNVTASLIECAFRGVQVDYENNTHLRSFDNAEMKCFEI